MVAIDHLSDATVHVLNADGFTPQGLPYFDFTAQMSGKTLGPGQATTARTLEFTEGEISAIMVDNPKRLLAFQ